MLRCNMEKYMQDCIVFLEYIDPDKEILLAKSCKYVLTHQSKHVFWVLKRTVSSRRFF